MCASTRPIRDEEGQPVPSSIAALEAVEIGGMEQWILIRWQPINNPVLLWLHSGPGKCKKKSAHSPFLAEPEKFTQAMFRVRLVV